MKTRLWHGQYFFLLITLLTLGISAAQAGTIQNLRGQRYCEIIFATQQSGSPQVKVYNTIGLNQCPEQLWDQLDIENLKKESGSFYVHLNGPRYWTIDEMQNSTLINPTIKSFGGITMREAGILKLKWTDFLRLQNPYQQHKVQRQTTWVYKAGKPVFELIDANKNIYIMQSYSVQKNSQTESSLTNLGGKLTLPAGWNFRTRILQKDAYLTPINQVAVVVQDDFLNTYQLETPGFDAK